jgi:hypothetical protein
MWLYPGPSCLDHPFSKELGEVEINTQIYKVLAHGVDPNPGASPTPLREGVDSTRVSPFAFTFGGLCSLIHSLSSRPSVGSHVCSQCATGVTIPEDAAKREANRACDKKLWEWKQRRQAWSTAQMAVRVRVEDTPSEPESSY